MKYSKKRINCQADSNARHKQAMTLLVYLDRANLIAMPGSSRKLLLIIVAALFPFILSGCTLIGGQKLSALQVTSSPEASVFLDGKHLGKTPYFSDQLKAGSYTLKVTASEASYEEKINLYEGALTVLNRDLAQNFLAQSGETLWLEEGKKGLLIVATPQDSDVTIDGTYKGKTPIQLIDIAEGDHKVLISKVGFQNREFTIKILPKYQLAADVFLASEIAKNGQSTSSPPPQITPAKIKVLKTPQGFLRVRRDPSLSSPEVGRVEDGDQLEVVQETEDWVKIIFKGKQGWISKQYTKKV